MELRGLLLVLGLIAVVAGQTCLPPFTPVAGKCLYVELSEQGSSMTWQESRDYCKALVRDLNSDLASFPTCDEFTDFARYMAFNSPVGNASIWMGVHTQFSSNMWQWVTLEALQTGVPFWYANSSFADGFECAASEADYFYRLEPADCLDAKAFACSYIPVDAKEPALRRAPTNCPNGGIIVGDYCYFFKDKTDTFDGADANCRADHGEQGGLLYYPENCNEFTAMAHHLEATQDTNKYWVGAVDISGQQEWTWVTGQLVPGGPPYWSVGEPSHDHANQPREHCATMSKERRYYLVDDHCAESYKYICKLTLA